MADEATGVRGVFYWDADEKKFKEGRPPSKIKKFGQAPLVLGDEIVGGRYSPGDGRVYESKKEWHRSLEENDIQFVPVGAKPPPKKFDRISDEEYARQAREDWAEAERMVKYREVELNEQEMAEEKQYREAIVNKYGTAKQRSRKLRKKLINGDT